jgi:hypothetical protein
MAASDIGELECPIVGDKPVEVCGLADALEVAPEFRQLGLRLPQGALERLDLTRVPGLELLERSD